MGGREWSIERRLGGLAKNRDARIVCGREGPTASTDPSKFLPEDQQGRAGATLPMYDMTSPSPKTTPAPGAMVVID
jgi:hypothetical protein